MTRAPNTPPIPPTVPSVLRWYEQQPEAVRIEWSERAAIHEHDGGMGREDAERAAMEVFQ